MRQVRWMTCTVDIYHSTFEWPSSSTVASRLQKADGTSEDEMVKRLVEHHRNITGVTTCYQHVLKVINADQPKSDVFSQGKCGTVLTVSPLLCTLTFAEQKNVAKLSCRTIYSIV